MDFGIFNDVKYNYNKLVTDTIDNRSSAYETAIGSKINNVFNSVQSL